MSGMASVRRLVQLKEGAACMIQAVWRMPHQQLSTGPCSTSASSPCIFQQRGMHTSSPLFTVGRPGLIPTGMPTVAAAIVQAQRRAAQIKGSIHPAEAEKELDMPIRPHAFASEQLLHSKTPLRRSPICFPTIILQLMKMSDEQVAQIRATGWCREVVFRTSPNVTKLEIKAYLEAVYGMPVERVSTINYLGRKYQVPVHKRGPHRKPYTTMREDDWKKAYVIFKPLPGAQAELADPGKTARPELKTGAELLAHLRQLKQSKGRAEAMSAHEGKPRQAMLSRDSIIGGNPALRKIMQDRDTDASPIPKQ